MDNLFLLSGLPRSGITVLSALLNQNPSMYVTTTSPFVEVLWRNYSLWGDAAYESELDTSKMQNLKQPFLTKMTNAYFSELTKVENVIDKRRQWQSITNIEMYKSVYGKLPKIICPVRSVDEIIVSYMKVYENTGIVWDYDKLMKGNRFETSYYQLKEVIESEYAKCVHLVEYDDLVSKPIEIIDKIYKFLGIDKFNHTFDTIVLEDEGNHKLKDLHKLRKSLSKNDTNIKDYLSAEQIEKFSHWNFWRK